MVQLQVIGLNCGTSVDGIDVAQVLITSAPDTSDVKIALLSYREHPIPPALRTRVLSLCRPGADTTLEEICDLNFELGELFAEAVLSSGIDLSQIDIIASHGQTLWHTPVVANQGAGYAAGERRMATLQMAEGAVLAQRTGLTVTNDFRVAELAQGRMGAPLAGFFEAALVRHPTKLRVSQNLGGMGNVTVIPPSNSPLAPGYMAFDTGPGNVLIDAAIRLLTNGVLQYDQDGIIGKRGEKELDQSFIDKFIDSVDYLAREPPKTTGRELFSDDMARRLVVELQARGMSDEGIIANITRITAETVVRALEQFVVPHYGKMEEIFICGGGAENPNIVGYVRQMFPNATVAKLNEATSPSPSKDATVKSTGGGIPADAKEAVMFALLGFLTVCGRSVPVASGEMSKEESIMGKVTPGRNYVEVMRKALCSEDQRGTLGRILVD
ncbi:Anhydro-N-acetylmuramic acid kinase [Naematelia encephala]|uniref:Anhydro-N-acetylmuramic acid kinase n=1 Tax=Naematelia encephala TaxID=71784 RepID=A0A1Y2BMV4_9TREE|nr:Anhydro-N-acetylmuramic acid kinase [Naematelia encephala]